MQTLANYTKRIEGELNKLSFPSSPEELYSPIKYILSIGGKRVRPALVFYATEMFSGNIDDAVSTALGIEVFHNFTLLHDDIMDKAPLRRGNPTVHEKWNTNIAILSGDTMLVQAYQLMAKSPNAGNVLDVFSKTATEVCEGQQFDMNFEERDDVSLAEYIDMITLKTAVLLGASLKIGAIISGANETDTENIYQFGKKLGIAFQIQDDILDVFGQVDKVGKQKGGDILANKKTWLLIKALELASPQQKENITGLLNSNPSDKIEKMTAIYQSLSVIILAEEAMEDLYKEAIIHLNDISVNEDLKSPLFLLSKNLIRREY